MSVPSISANAATSAISNENSNQVAPVAADAQQIAEIANTLISEVEQSIINIIPRIFRLSVLIPTSNLTKEAKDNFFNRLFHLNEICTQEINSLNSPLITIEKAQIIQAKYQENFWNIERDFQLSNT